MCSGAGAGGGDGEGPVAVRRWSGAPGRGRAARCGRPGCGSGRVTTASRVMLFQSKLRSGWVCSRASMTSASSGLRPTARLEGDRNTYNTRVRGDPFEGRATCMTYVCSNPRLSRVCRIKGTELTSCAPVWPQPSRASSLGPSGLGPSGLWPSGPWPSAA